MQQTRPIPLPSLAELPRVVLFHRTHPQSPRLLLRVPTGPESAESYVLRIDQKPQEIGTYNPALDHRGWLRRLPNSKDLLHKLTYEMHIAYYPHDGGTVWPLSDPDEVPWVRKLMMHARRDRQGPLAQAVRQQRLRSPRSIPKPALHSAIQRATGRGA